MSMYKKIVWYMKGSREYTKSGFEAASKNFKPSDLEEDVSKTSFLITGASSGLGKAVALELATRGGTVHIICRNKEKGERCLRELQESSSNSNIFLHIVDVSRPAEIKAFTDNFIASGKTLDVLINNAGLLVPDEERQLTPEGLETTFATNTLGSHVLTRGCLPLLSQTENSRVILVSSGGMLLQKLDISDLEFQKMKKFDGVMAYSQTKRQQVIMATKYAESHPNIRFFSMHPGWADTPGVEYSLPDFYQKMKNKLRTVEQGADTIVWLAIAKSALQFPNGSFFQDRSVVSTHLPLAWTRSNSEDETKLMQILDDYMKKFS